jgi:hypothetical protein
MVEDTMDLDVLHTRFLQFLDKYGPMLEEMHKDYMENKEHKSEAQRGREKEQIRHDRDLSPTAAIYGVEEKE